MYYVVQIFDKYCPKKRVTFTELRKLYKQIFYKKELPSMYDWKHDIAQSWTVNGNYVTLRTRSLHNEL